jgi:hypothetical protein
VVNVRCPESALVEHARVSRTMDFKDDQSPTTLEGPSEAPQLTQRRSLPTEGAKLGESTSTIGLCDGSVDGCPVRYIRSISVGSASHASLFEANRRPVNGVWSPS